MLFPTIEFLLFFLLSFGIYHSVKTEKQKITAIVFFNLIFYSFSHLNVFLGFGDFVFHNATTIYLFLWSFLIYLSGKTLKIRFFVIGFSILQLIYWKSVDAGFIDFKPISTPLGISFFTFQGLTYLFARMQLPVRNPEQHIDSPWGFWKVLAFTGFFPTVLSGPIMRAKSWENNLQTPVVMSQSVFSKAMTFIAIGCFYKLCISSYFHDYVTMAYSDPSEETGINILIGLFSYTFEIYHDFAGYSLMAIGIALLLGFSIPENFKQPYLSRNIRDFWQRWHISFSFWLRDYFYISALGGSKHGEKRHIFNVFLVMIVCGAWHGLSGNYLIWGLLHALAVVVFHLIKDKIHLPKFLGWLITFLYVSIAWVFFRAPDAKTGFDFIGRLFFSEAWSNQLTVHDIFVFILFVLVFFIQYIENLFMKIDWKYSSFIFNNKFSYITWGLIFVLILIVSPSGMPPFIYFSY